MSTQTANVGLETVSGDLVRWVGAVLADVPCQMRGPADPQPEDGIAVRLVGVDRSDAARPGAITFLARYLLCVLTPDVLGSHRVFGELLFAAAEQGGVQLGTAQAAREALAHLGLPACPALLVEAPLVRARRTRPVGIVRHPLRLTTEVIASSDGEEATEAGRRRV